ncbi:MAG: WecB/TagA/CpsF family glycosyltransferase [Candidatus Andersenbacteria bacterium]|nr:WecB/TagA/CpsF family glycosyltransferase [Candidatus Andersenbacteria bacterium]
MSEPVQLGQVTCDFMNPREFAALCQRWITGQTFRHIVTLNPEMIMLAEQNSSFRSAVAGADIRVPDGAGLVWARWYLRSRYWPLFPSLLAFLWQPVERVTGVDAVLELARLCESCGQLLYLLGGANVHRERTAAVLRHVFPKLAVATSPDDAKALTDITRRQPAVLLVAYGAPKQTIWIEQRREQLAGTVRMAIGVGGAFAMLSEDLPRAPQFLQRRNLEWLWRFYLEPKRAPRIWQATVSFPILIHRQKKERNDSLRLI